ncbi:archease [Zavarzinella formosa]|uniref:archease n=1 Tax=Zavarzinella formosa TaxID=360055 RepID=UPI0002F0C8D2|nr:archease [Zavarzinella formosa]
MHEFFDHTADLGFRMAAETWPALLEEAAVCLFEAMVEEPSTIRPVQQVAMAIVGTEREYLLFDWLRALLFQAEGDGMLFSRFEVTETETGIIGQAWGEPLDHERHQLSHEVKAITYHGLSVVRTPTGWMAEVIVDI